MSKRKLLLADDSVTIQKVVSLTFADEGIEVVSTGDGDSAMAKIAEIKPDLIMADVNMPGLNGYQVCEKIRQDESISKTPVILLVGSFEPFDEEEAKRVGADDYMTKPFQSIRQLVNKVTVLLNSNGEQAAPAEIVDAAPTAVESISEYQLDTVEEPSALESASDYARVEIEEPAEIVETTDSETTEGPEFAVASPFAAYETVKFESRDLEAEVDSEAEDVAPVVEEAPSEPTELVVEKAAFEEEMPLPDAVSVLELDDDFLELPPIEDDTAAEDESTREAKEAAADRAFADTWFPPAEEAKMQETQPVIGESSSEIVAEVTNRVVARLSEGGIRDMVREVAEQVVKEMAKEKP